MRFRNDLSSLEALTSIDGLSHLTDSQRRALLPYTDVVTVPARTILDRKGSVARQLVGVLAGSVRSFDSNGHPVVLLPGGHYGETELLSRERHGATYTTTTTTTVVVVFGPAFASIVRRDLPTFQPAGSAPRPRTNFTHERRNPHGHVRHPHESSRPRLGRRSSAVAGSTAA